MTAPRLPERDGGDIEALMADRYLEALLEAAENRADDAPADAALPTELREAARVLRDSLVRVHPSFRFEEGLADRLRALAWAQAASGAAGNAAILPFGRPAVAPDDADPLLAAILAGELDPGGAEVQGIEARLAAARRPLIVGGAITSAAISLVGVAWVAWRAARPGGHPTVEALARAASAAHAAAASAGLSGGIGGRA